MGIYEYENYIHSVYAQEVEKENYNIIVDKPVIIVDDRYRTEKQIKELHDIVVIYNHKLESFVKHINNSGFYYDFEHSFLHSDRSLGFIQQCSFGNDIFINPDIYPKEFTLTIKNLTFADYYNEFCFAYTFNNSINLVLENVNFNYIHKLNEMFLDTYVKTLKIINCKMPCINKEEFPILNLDKSILENIDFENVNFETNNPVNGGRIIEK